MCNFLFQFIIYMLDFSFIIKLFGLVSCYTWRPYIKKYTSGSFTREESIVFENTVNYLLMLFYIYFISKKFKLLLTELKFQKNY